MENRSREGFWLRFFYCWLGLEAAERRVLTRRSALLQGVGVLPCVLPLHCGFWGGVLAPLLAALAAAWLPPAAKEGQGDCDFPLGPPWILLYPLKRRRSARGLEAAERGVLARRAGAGEREMGRRTGAGEREMAWRSGAGEREWRGALALGRRLGYCAWRCVNCLTHKPNWVII